MNNNKDKKAVHEISSLTGISIRALHYYDQIGLLKPSNMTESGYRLYTQEDLERLQQILFFRELDFPLKEIKKLMDHPDFDKNDALQNHKYLLEMKRDRLEHLILLVERILKGENDMSFKEFDRSEIEKAQQQYANEVQTRWGDTDAYRESKQKTEGYSQQQWQNISQGWEDIFKSFAAYMHTKDPSSAEVQKLVEELQAHITTHFYHCTDEILSGLGELYINDERFTQNIDAYGQGLSVFIRNAIAFYCKNKA